MRRIEKGISKTFKHCWLYKDELEQVINLLTVNGTPPQIRCGEFEIDSADELYGFLGKKGKRVLDVQSNRPSIRISTSTYSGAVDVFTYDESNDARALVSRVLDVLENGARKPHWRGRFSTYGAGTVLAIYGAMGAYAFHDARRYFAAGACVVGIFLFLAHVTYRKVEGTRFFGIARADRQTFIQRKGDDLAVGLISGVVGAVIGGVLGVVGTLMLQK